MDTVEFSSVVMVNIHFSQGALIWILNQDEGTEYSNNTVEIKLSFNIRETGPIICRFQQKTI